MKTILKSLIRLFVIGLSVRATGQVVVTVSSLPSFIGDYDLSYVRTNFSLGSLVGGAGSNYWDFSQAPTPADVIQRLDIVSVNDGGNGAYFPSATYAQRYTGGVYASPSYEYYQISNGVGRLYYGLYEAQNQDADPLVVFPQATVDLPDPIQYGHGWNRSLTYQITTIFGPASVTFSETATVDAYGTLVLPGFGPLQSLRFTAIDTYDYAGGITQVDTNYVWLVPGIGFAAEVIISGPDSIGDPPPFTNYLQRVFLSPPLAPAPSATLSLESNTVNLSWSSNPKASGYVVMTSTNPATMNWTPVAQLTNSTLSIQMQPGIRQQFYQVTAQP